MTGVIAFLSGMTLIHYPVAKWICWSYSRSLSPEQRESVARAVKPALMRLAIANITVALLLGIFIIYWVAAAPGRHWVMAPAGLLTFHGLWWPFVLPVLRELDRAQRACGAIPAHGEAPRFRKASLARRTLSEYLPAWWILAQASVLVVLPTFLAVRVMGAESVGVHQWVSILVNAGMAIVTMLTFPWWYHFFTNKLPQPKADVVDDAALDAVQDAFRTHRVRVAFYLQLCVGIGLFLGALVAVEVARDTISGPMAGRIGGLIGTTAGIGGAIIGVRSSRKTYDLQREIARTQDRSNAG
jgi:hypothetical protein